MKAAVTNYFTDFFYTVPDAPRNVWSRDIVYQKLDSNDPGELVSIMLTWSPVVGNVLGSI